MHLRCLFRSVDFQRVGSLALNSDQMYFGGLRASGGCGVADTVTARGYTSIFSWNIVRSSTPQSQASAKVTRAQSW